MMSGALISKINIYIPISVGVVRPFTLTDNYSRLLLSCAATYVADRHFVIPCLEVAFQEYGLPLVIRTDNGVPFAGDGLHGLSQLSVWLIKCGVLPERIRRGKPTENGRHERMHRTMKEAMSRYEMFDSLEQQQQWFDNWRKEFNEVRPHKALGGKTPQMLWSPSGRIFIGPVNEMPIPDDTKVFKVGTNGDIRVNGKRLFLSESLMRKYVWMKSIDNDIDEIGFGRMILAKYNGRNHRIIRTD